MGVLILMAAGVVAANRGSGPDTGRWKWSGTSCYWDANDSGPDQCDPNAPPTGRWNVEQHGMLFRLRRFRAGPVRGGPDTTAASGDGIDDLGDPLQA